MFPIPWNFPLRKKNGNLVNIGDAIDAGTEIPEHGEGDAGKVLSVDENGGLEWSDEVNSEIQTLTNKLDDEIETRAKLGAHNLLIGGVSTTSGNVTGMTRNEDGSVTIEPRTELPRGELYFSVRGSLDLFLPNGEYILTGGLSTDILMSAGYTNSSGNYVSLGNDTGNGITFTINGCNLRDDGAYLTVFLLVYENVEITSTLTVYPMIRLAIDSDTTYQPYAMTNRELTEDVSDIIGDTSIDRLTLLDPQPAECSFGYAHIYDNGIMFQTSGLITLSADIATNEFIKVGTVAESHRPNVDRTIQCAKISGPGTVYGSGLVIKSNGDVTFNVRPGMKTTDQFLANGACIK